MTALFNCRSRYNCVFHYDECERIDIIYFDFKLFFSSICQIQLASRHVAIIWRLVDVFLQKKMFLVRANHSYLSKTMSFNTVRFIAFRAVRL